MRADVRRHRRQHDAAVPPRLRPVVDVLQEAPSQMVALPVLPHGDAEPRDRLVDVPEEHVSDHLLGAVLGLDRRREVHLPVLSLAVDVLDDADAVNVAAVEHRAGVARHLVEELDDHPEVVVADLADRDGADVHDVVHENDVEDVHPLVDDWHGRYAVLGKKGVRPLALGGEQELRLEIRGLPDARVEVAARKQEPPDVPVGQRPRKAAAVDGEHHVPPVGAQKPEGRAQRLVLGYEESPGPVIGLKGRLCIHRSVPAWHGLRLTRRSRHCPARLLQLKS